MSGEIGSAFVRVRPNAAGFKSETEAGVRHGLSGVSKIIAGAFAVGAVVEFGKKVVQAAESEQVAVTKTKKAVQDASLGWFSHKKAIEETIQTQARATGFMQHDLYDAFANMIRTTGNVKEALHLNSVAMDIARTKGMDLASAQSLLARVHNGAFMGLKRLGVTFPIVTAAQDKLKGSSKDFITAELILAKSHGTRGFALQQLKEKLQSSAAEQLKAAKADDKRATAQGAIAAATQKFSGQATAYAHTAAGAQDRLSEAMNELEATAGKKLLPTIANLASELANELPSALKEVKADTQAVSGFFKEYGDVIEPVAGSILGLVVALKAYSVAQRVAGAVSAVYQAGQKSVRGLFISEAEAAATLKAANAQLAASEQELQVALTQQAVAIGQVAEARSALAGLTAEGVATETELAAAQDAVMASESRLLALTNAVTSARTAQVGATEAATTAQAELDVAMDANPIGAVVAAVGLLVGALTVLYQTSGTVRGVLQSIGNLFKSDSFSAHDAAHATQEYRQALDDLKHDQQGLTDAHDRLAGAKLQVQEADARLTQLQRQGKRGTLEYKEAQLQLREAHHAVKSAVLDVEDAEKKRNATLGKGNKAIGDAWNQGIKLSKTAELVAKWTHDAGKGSEYFNATIGDMIQKAGGAKTPLGEALATLQKLSTATGKAPSAADWDRVFGHLTTLPSKSLTKAQRDAESKSLAVGNAIKKGIVSGVTGLDTDLGNYISQQIQTAIDNAGKQHHGSGPFQDTIHKIGKPMADGMIEGWITGSKPLSGVMSQTIKDAIVQAQQSVRDAIGQAKANLQSIGGSIAGLVGDFFGAPQQNQQQQEALKAAKTNLANLNVSGAAPDEVAAARAAVKAAQAEINRSMLQRRLADLSDELGRGQITKAAFNRDVDGLLGKLGLSYAKLKKEMGVAFADQYQAEVRGLKAQAGAIVAGPRRNDITGFEPQIVKPLDALNEGTKQVREAIKTAGAAGLAESKKQTAHLKKIAQSTADTAAAQKYVDTHPQPGVNPNHSASRAKRR